MRGEPLLIQNNMFSNTFLDQVLELVKANQMCLDTLMGSGEGCITFIRRANSRETSPTQDRRNGRRDTFEDTTEGSCSRLRCLKI